MSIWKEYIKPIVVLVCICLVVSIGLAITNDITTPIITQNNIRIANETRTQLMPDATGFETVEYEGIVSAKEAGVTEIYKAENKDAYIITAQAKGYNGMIPVMVAFDDTGKILAVRYMENGETAGLGQKVRDAWFQDQFAKKEAKNYSLSEVDAITGATISSSAALTALNSAVDAYVFLATGEEKIEWTEDLILETVLPEAGALQTEEAGDAQAIYTGANYGTIVVATAEGFYKKPVIAYVGFDNDGVITGVYIDGNNETKGVGQQITGLEYAAQFVGKTQIEEVDIIAGATVSSDAATQAVQNAIEIYTSVKGAA